MALFNNFQRNRYFLKSLSAVPKIIIAGISAIVQALPPRKFLSCDRATNEMVGQMMLLAVTIIGIGTITVYGLPTILSLQEMANARNGQQSLTVIDSQVSKAIIGFSPSQTSNINLGGGTLTLLPNSTNDQSYVTVSSNNFSFTIPMGKIEYTLGDQVVAYEGGGMWAKYPTGKSIMLSPPALHYNGGILSLPVINISGSGSVGGKGVATLSVTKNQPLVVFPNTSKAGWANRTNPVIMSKAGYVRVNITSDFYDAWAAYANSSLGYVNVSEDPNNRTVSLNLSLVPNNLGENTSITNPIVINGLNTSDTTPLDDFSFMLVPFGGRLDWDIRSKTGQQKLIFDVSGTNPVSLNVGYENDSTGYQYYAETWNGTGVFAQPGGYYYIDMLNTSLNLTYTNISVSANNSNSCQPFGGVINPDLNKFNSTQFTWPSAQYTTTTTYNYKNQFIWNFSNDLQGWTYNLGTGRGASANNVSNYIYSQVQSVSGSNHTGWSTITWKSPNFTWNNGTPVSAQINFDWNLLAYTHGSPGSLFAVLVKPDNTTSQVSPIILINSSTQTGVWFTSSNTTVSVNDFNQSGNYSLKLIAILITQNHNNAQVEVGWRNPNITINSIGYSTTTVTEPQPTNRSLYDITQHYFSLMDQSGELSFGDCGPYQPAANSTMLMSYNATGGETYLQISDNQVDATIN